ncbi:inorganic phosphate transporter PitA [Candidatus Profftia sp. (ex Adelges kitamiensis)]|uniref:inorganic phosphate transporter PitA n=1 Tax=Candidatus Profftia sp. (ex Adelges kitamiensis) TaxID=2864218 RepID=UPI001CE2AE01|nr:inorganic phosphate transporter PitA [Candidatus Profftia sp. (ex Adelges kitamiensis)]
MLDLFIGLNFLTSLMLICALIFVLFYEAINGFHDTANAVAIVIYTRALRSQIAVIMSGIFNFLGVILGGLSVAYAIVHLLPIDLLLNVGTNHVLTMMFSLLLSAIIWNLGTWYFALPASSSHTIIGAILGVVLTNSIITHTSILDDLNIAKIIEILFSLILSPLIGLVLASLMVFILRRYWNNTKKRRRIHMTPAERTRIDGKRKPPFWIRIALSLSAIGVSFSHGANDGQKGIGLLMLVLIGLAPARFVVNMDATSYDISRTRDAIIHLEQYYHMHQKYMSNIIRVNSSNTINTTTTGHHNIYCDDSSILIAINHAKIMLHNLQSYNSLNLDERNKMRRLLICFADTASKAGNLAENDIQDKYLLNNLYKDLLKTVEYTPISIIVMVALSLSFGTIIGWRRVANTICKKIGKKDMTYAQGISAQITTAISIGVASYTGMPVSTTLVLSSAIAGTMIADGSGVQKKTIKSILLVWLISLPTAMILSSILYWFAFIFII